MAHKIYIVILSSIVSVYSQFMTPYWMTYYHTSGGSNGPSADQYSNYQPIMHNNQETFSSQGTLQTSFSSPCNQYFSYQSDYNGQYGLVSVPVPAGVSQFQVKVKLSLAARLMTVRNCFRN